MADVGAAGLSGGMPSSIVAYNPYWVGRDGRTNDMRGTQIPYVINHHTGISLSAHSAYSGIRLWLQGGSTPYNHDGTLVAQFSTAINHYVHTAATTITATGTITAPTFTVGTNCSITTTAGYLGLRSNGNEMTIGGSAAMYVNYRAALGGTPTTWRWLAGSPTSYADFHLNNLYAYGAATATRFYTGYDSGVTSSMSCSNWFRSSGATGWLNATYGGGIYQDDSTYVKVYGSKALKVDSTASYSINTDGGIRATAGFAKTGYTDLYMLLAGGGTKLLSDFRLKSEKVLKMVFRGYFRWTGTNLYPTESNVVYSDFCTSYVIKRVSAGRYNITFTGLKTTSNIAQDTTLQIFGAGRNINLDDESPCYVAISNIDTNYFDIIIADDNTTNDSSIFTLYINQMI